MKKINIINTAFCLLLISYTFLGIAFFNADFLIENEANKMAGLKSMAWIDFAVDKNLLNYMFGIKSLPVFLGFFTPMITIMQKKQSKLTKNIMITLIIVLLVNNINQFFQFEGGDYKGCFGCEINLLLHFVFGVLSIMIAITTFTVFKFKKN